MVGALLRDAKVRGLALQVLLVGAVLTALTVLVVTTIANLRARGVPLGFGFLGQPAGMPIAETFLAFSPDDTYARAILVGLVNTLVVAVLSIGLASVAGLFVGIGRLSSNPLVSGLCRVWVEIARNTPAVVLLLFLYALWWQLLPPPRDAITLAPGTFLSQRGLVAPRVTVVPNAAPIILFAGPALAALWLAQRGARGVQDRTGRRPPYVVLTLAGLACLGSALLPASGLSLAVDWPEFRRLNFVGGSELTPELTTIVVGLTFYTAGFIAEIVRGGILAIGKGQWEAGRAVGLSEARILRLVIVPQTLRVVVPPLTSQYINVVKNSTLAIVVGFQDFMTVLQTIINQTSHAIEGVAIILGSYLALNLILSVLLNWYNGRIAIIER